MSTDLTILTITEHKPHAAAFIDDMADLADRLGANFVCWNGKDAGLLEYVLDDALATCDDGYVLLLADDERASDEMRDWLFARHYRTADHWAFPRRHPWPSADTFIVSPPYWPDLQTRLSVKEKSGGRRQLHAGSPYGTGTVADCPIDHHKFLVRTLDERRDLLAHYASIDPVAVTPHYAAFSIPEDVPYIELALMDNSRRLEASVR